MHWVSEEKETTYHYRDSCTTNPDQIIRNTRPNWPHWYAINAGEIFLDYGVPRPFDEIHCSSTPYIKACSRGSLSAFGHFSDVWCSSNFAKWQLVWIYSSSHRRIEIAVTLTYYGPWKALTPSKSGFSRKSECWHQGHADSLACWQWNHWLDCWFEICPVS